MDLRAKGRRPQDVQMVFEKVRPQQRVVEAPTARSGGRKADVLDGQYSHGALAREVTTPGDHK